MGRFKSCKLAQRFRFLLCRRLQCLQCSTTPDLPTNASAVWRAEAHNAWRDTTIAAA
jgi:hypothetical protein